MAKNPENYKRSPSTINKFEQALLAHNEYWYIQKQFKNNERISLQMDRKKEL